MSTCFFLGTEEFLKREIDHGDMSSTARSVSLRQFNHMAEYRVMLLSLKAGGIGLNLQRANHMVILDRWWNPGKISYNDLCAHCDTKFFL